MAARQPPEKLPRRALPCLALLFDGEVSRHTYNLHNFLTGTEQAQSRHKNAQAQSAAIEPLLP